MDAATTPHDALAARTNDRCPSCSAPMVGTNPRRPRWLRSAREAERISSMAVQIFMGLRLRGSGTGTGFPFDGHMSALQFTVNNAAFPSNRNFVLLGTCVPGVNQDRYHPAIRPGG